jgi:hypothetical protein
MLRTPFRGDGFSESVGGPRAPHNPRTGDAEIAAIGYAPVRRSARRGGAPTGEAATMVAP